MDRVPNFATHHHHGERRPFLTLSDLPEDQLELMLATLSEPAEREVSARRFGPRYMALRRATETCLREHFIAGGGAPQRGAPHYFVLGESPWFAGLYLEGGSVCLPLSALPPEVTSFTWADSITTMGQGIRLGLPAPVTELAGRVFRLDELDEVTSRYGLPAAAVAPGALGGYDGHQQRPVDDYVEIQLWSDEPVLTHLGGQ